ncbi:MAG: protein-glutamate O-methyltransferase CheR [Negativicutes bacterium]|nr:protein-glutamate O-methyltransferase CheR [Negativicutes bacterium]
MVKTISSSALGKMQRFIRDNAGLVIEDERAYLLETRLARLLVDYRCADFDELYRCVDSGRYPELADKIINAVVTHETQWFREMSPWRVMERLLLPRWQDELAAGSRTVVRIWSAACSTGQEPYSIAMLIDDYFSRAGRRSEWAERFTIIASDISGAALGIARQGRYEAIAMGRGLPDDYRNRYFSQQGRVWQLADAIRRRVDFYRCNLIDEASDLGLFDAIFLRNILIYFADEVKTAVVEKTARQMNPGGILFLGNAEMMPENSCFSQRKIGDDIYYVLKENSSCMSCQSTIRR